MMKEKRIINEVLVNHLNEVKKAEDDFALWKKFYDFIIYSYSLPREQRYSVSGLYYALAKMEFEKTAEMTEIYAHGIYLLAKRDNLEIYGDNFNV